MWRRTNLGSSRSVELHAEIDCDNVCSGDTPHRETGIVAAKFSSGRRTSIKRINIAMLYIDWVKSHKIIICVLRVSEHMLSYCT